MSVVGTAHVVVRAITKNLDSEIAAGVTKACDAATKDSGVTSSAEKTGKHVGESIGVGVERGGGKAVVDAVEKTVDKAKDDPRVGDAGERVGTTIGIKMGAGLFAASSSFSKIAVLMGTKLAMLGSLVQPLVQLVAAAGAQILAFSATLGPPLVAASVAGAGAITAFGMAAAAVMVALGTKTPMLEEFKARLAETGKQFSVIGASIQEALLPQLETAFGNLTTIIPTLTVGLTKMGGAVGAIAVQLSQTITSGENMGRLDRIFESSATVVGSFGRAISNLISPMLTVLDAARPLTEQFAKWTEKLTVGWAASIQAGAESGKLAGFLERAGQAASKLGDIFSNVFWAIANVMQVANSHSTGMLDSLVRMTEKMYEWTRSGEGIERLNALFSNGNIIMAEVWKLLGLIGSALGEMATNNPAAIISLLQAFQNLVPLLPTLFGGLTDLLNVFASLLAIPIVGQLVAIGAAMSPLILGASRLIGPMISLVGTMITASGQGGILATVFGALGGISAPVVVAVLAIVGAIAIVGTALYQLWNDNQGFRDKVTAAWEAIKQAGAQLGQALTGLWNAIGEGITKVAQAMGFEGADFTKAESFTDVLNGVKDALGRVWDFYKSYVAFMVPILMGAIKALINYITTVVGVITAIVNFVSPIIAAVVSAVSAVAGVIGSIFSTVFNVVSTVLGAVFGVVSSVFGAIWSVIGPVLGAIGNLISTVFGTIFSVVSTVIGAVFSVVSTVFTAIWSIVGPIVMAIGNLISAVFGAISSVVSSVLNAIFSVVSAVFTAIWSVVSPIVMAISNLVSAVFGAIFAVISAILSAVWGVISSVFNAIFNVVSSILNAVWGVVSSVFNTVLSVISSVMGVIGPIVSAGVSVVLSVWNRIVDGVGGVASRVAGIVGGAFNSIVGFLQNVAGSVADVINRFAEMVSAVGNSVSQAVSHVSGLASRAASALGDVGSTLYNKGKELIQGFIDGILSLAGNVASAVASAVGLGSSAVSAQGSMSAMSTLGSVEPMVAPMSSSSISPYSATTVSSTSSVEGALASVLGGAIGDLGSSASLGGGVTVKVFIGQTELTQLVTDVQVQHDLDLSRSLVAGGW